MRKDFSVKIGCFDFCYIIIKKTKKTLLHKNLVGINYCKVNCIVIHSIL